MATITLQQALELALQHHRAGRLSEAESLYRQILLRQPRHSAALQLLGVVAHQGGRNDVAVSLIRQALAIDPNYVEAYSNLGAALKETGRADEAIAAYRQAIALDPRFPDAHGNLGHALWEKGQLDEAIAACRAAIALRPHYPDAYNNLGNALSDNGQLHEAVAAYRQAILQHPGFASAYNNLATTLIELGQLDEAIAACRQAIALDPRHVDAHSNLGSALKAKGQLSDAIAVYRQAIALRPDHAQAHCNLGVALRQVGRFDEAGAAFRTALALKPDFAEVHCNLANMLFQSGQLDQAIAGYRNAISLKPSLVEAHSNLGDALRTDGQWQEAIAACRQAIALKPDSVEGHANLALSLLLKGDFQAGWQEYEWRRKIKEFSSTDGDFPQTRWDGSDLMYRTILLHAEQGLGDAIQFVRYVPLVLEKGGSVVLQCQQELKKLLQQNASGWQVFARGEQLPPADVQCPLLSLPLAFATDLQNIPAPAAYLKADEQEIDRWRAKLSGDGARLKVGLAWAGSKLHRNDQRRSMALADFAPLAGAQNVRFYSLQKGEAAAQAARPPAGLELIDQTEDLSDLADTAALIANLDLVICIDTAVAHLAGAMGKPVWVLLPLSPDWRWLLERDDSPWYPSMRLFRKTRKGDWEDVVRRVSEQLDRKTEPRS